MTYRMTVVLEYANVEDAPRMGPLTEGKDMGKFKVCAMQFSDALRELEVLEDAATEAVKDAAHRAAFSYPGCTDPRQPVKPPANESGDET